MPAKKRPGKKNHKDTRSTQEIEDSRVHKFQLNLRISDLARELLGRIAEKHGMNLTHALEYSIRQTAREEGVFSTPASH